METITEKTARLAAAIHNEDPTLDYKKCIEYAEMIVKEGVKN